MLRPDETAVEYKLVLGLPFCFAITISARILILFVCFYSNSPLGKVNNGNSVVSKNAGWGDVNTSSANVSDLWAMPKSRGPPPGLTTNNKNSNLGGGGGNASNSNGWGSLGSPRWPSMANSQNTWMGSPWLLLRNLTPQVKANDEIF